MQMVGMQGWDVNPWSYSGSKSSSAPASNTDLHKGAVLGRRDLWRSHCPQHSVAVQGHLTGQLGSAKPGGSWSCPLLAQQLCRALLAHFTAGHTWLLLAQTDGGRWVHGEDGLSTPPKVLERVPSRQQPNMGFSPVPRIHHHCESSNSGPELLPLPKQPGPASAPSPCSAHTPVPSKPPIVGTPAWQTPPQHKEGISAP